MSCRRKPFLRPTTDGAINHSRGNERRLLGTDRDPVPSCMCVCVCCKELLFCCFWLCIVCFKSKEPRFFDSLAENDVIRRFPSSAKVYIYIYIYIVRERGRNTNICVHATRARKPGGNIWIVFRSWEFGREREREGGGR